jgi:signal transduction histidine kinase
MQAIVAGIAGPADGQLNQLGRRFSAVARLLAVGLPSLLSLVVEVARHPWLAVVTAVAFNLWNFWYAFVLWRSDPRRLVAIDLALVCVVCMTQSWTGPADVNFEGASWVYVATAIVVVTAQLHTAVAVGALIAVVVPAAYLAGVAAAAPEDWRVEAPYGLWLVVEAVLSRAGYLYLRRQGRVGDAAIARIHGARREAAIAQARRADEREYLAALHDTAAATLFMVGAGVLAGDLPWLRSQAARDLKVISGEWGAADQQVDLAAVLRDLEAHSPLALEWLLDHEVRVPTRVAIALCGGAREALTNVVRHAGVESARVELHRAGAGVIVEVSDRGRGFDADQLSQHRYGVAASLVERMAGIGGRATVTSSPGHGTRVRMEWPDDHR